MSSAAALGDAEPSPRSPAARGGRGAARDHSACRCLGAAGLRGLRRHAASLAPRGLAGAKSQLVPWGLRRAAGGGPLPRALVSLPC